MLFPSDDPIRSEGYTRQQGEQMVPSAMSITVRHPARFGGNERAGDVVVIRIGVLPKGDNTGFPDLAEYGIELSLEQARQFYENLTYEIGSLMADKMAMEGF